MVDRVNDGVVVVTAVEVVEEVVLIVAVLHVLQFALSTIFGIVEFDGEGRVGDRTVALEIAFGRNEERRSSHVATTVVGNDGAFEV